MKGRKEQPQPLSLASLSRRDRIAIVVEVIHTLWSIDGWLGDHLDEDNMRELARRTDVPVMVLCEAFDTPIQPTTGDLHEWCAYERAGEVA
jgi:hypothetical protein